MTRILWMVLWAVTWAVVFLLGAALIVAADMLSHHGQRNIELVSFSGFFATGSYVFLLCFSGLPGARSPAGQPATLGAMDGIWAILAFLLLQGAGAVTLLGVTYAEDLLVHHWQLPYVVHLMSPALPFLSVMAGELAACLWVAWYLRRLGPERLADGSASGVAWRPSEWRGYYTAVGMSVGVLLLVAGITRLVPPDMNALKGTGFDELANGPAWTMPFLLLLIVFLGPALEELLFRGIMFAGLAQRFGGNWAWTVTTLVFVAVHAPEKIHYPAGFLDVGLAAVALGWLRLRFNSIRPGMLLHMLYNAGSMLVVAGMK
jgi:membrane protease YdiL (CAAX protease family)